MIDINKRLTREFGEIMKDSVRSLGIYYWINEANMRNGKGMIIGPEDTPYAYCPLIFDVNFSSDYPLNPPSVIILTSDGVTRFHPNLYVNGKVCLSILGTFSGPKWSPIMTTSNIFMSILSLLDNNPIANEPGFEKYGPGSKISSEYTALVQFRMVAMTFRKLQAWKKGEIPQIWKEFDDVFDEIGDKLYDRICRIIREKAEKGEEEFDKVSYGMSGKTGWNDLLGEMASVKLAEPTLKLQGK
jgi:hypothetical protein